MAGQTNKFLLEMSSHSQSCAQTEGKRRREKGGYIFWIGRVSAKAFVYRRILSWVQDGVQEVVWRVIQGLN